MAGDRIESEQPYWSGFDPGVTQLLQALRDFRRANTRMRRRMSSQMGVNVTDVQALQVVIAAERAGTPASPRVLSQELGISTASTTKLIDRLVQGEHLRREPHPSDRRSVVLIVTEHAHRDIHRQLGAMHMAMARAAAQVDPETREQVVIFLEAMTQVMEKDWPPQETGPGE